MSGPASPEPPPVTGHPDIDAALADLHDLDLASVSEHHDRFAHAHETLQRALDARPEQADGPQPTR